MITPARRIADVPEYYFSRKLKEVAQLNAEGKDIISLAIGSPDMPPSPHTIETLCRAAQCPDAHGYQPTVGIPELKRAMANFYQRRYKVSLNPLTEIQPLIGSKEGILHTTLAFVNPGEKVLIPNPGYPTYTALSKLLGCEVIYYDLKTENGWQPDFEALEALDLSDVKLMWTNYPHMPTGAVALKETYEKLVAFARRHNLLIVNDNPYSMILNRNPQSILQVEGAMDCCIEFNSMSKSHNMPGWRVGMLVAKAEYIQYILRVKTNVDSGTFRALQLAAAAAYDNDDAWHEVHNYEVYAQRRHYAEQIMDLLHCEYDPNQVGMFLWGRIPDHYDTVETLTERLLHEARVFITPGFIFGSNGNRYIRISLCTTKEKFQEALRRINMLNL
ncbi:MAG: aminotransferase class I/II-fold pyridoxal phosphate-dependent enzyme [Bacteroidaceae bacterium]|nr:aminotransferase class I/II-fold pyridoxal phosphate-dependent enzyme [Bacteroidaceae bacterium]